VDLIIPQNNWVRVIFSTPVIFSSRNTEGRYSKRFSAMVKMHLFALASPIDCMTKSLQLDVANELAMEASAGSLKEKLHTCLNFRLSHPFHPQ